MSAFDSMSLIPEDIYSKHLKAIGGTAFTRREIDIIACLLSGRAAKKIAYFLKISPKTVETHMRNIMLKIGGSSRESVIDFIEKNGKFSVTRKYYQYLLIKAGFEKSLIEISALIRAEKYACTLAYEQDEQALFISYLQKHLNAAEIEVRLMKVTGQEWVKNPHPPDFNTVIYVVSDATSKNFTSFLSTPSFFKSLILFPMTEDASQINKENHLILTEQEDYYFLILEMLKKLLHPLDLEKPISVFKGDYKTIQNSDGNPPLPMLLETGSIGDKETHFKAHLFKIKAKKILALTGFICLNTITVWFLLGHSPQILFNNNAKEHISRSDLAIPVENSFLPRTNILKQIEDSFKESQDIQAVALIGIGGAGKTTLARQYARTHHFDLMWEFNAETKESLLHSFENLAYSLAQTEKEQRILSGIQDIRSVEVREKNLMFFVQQRLRKHSSWLLIFDNVEQFIDIQKYFPHDAKVWGKGKVIVITRDLNIRSNSYLSYSIVIGELSAREKFNLFTQIMGNGTQFLSTQSEQAEAFLAHIPSFPLDVSISTYYLKAANISYEEYLKRLNKYDEQFIGIQARLMKDASDYAKTRYSIIATSLQKIIDKNKDFSELLLFISLLDSQEIPRELLNAYKKDAVIDSLIYNLKKYSLIVSDNSSGVNAIPSFSLHRSIQEISRIYLTKALNIEKNGQLLQSFVNTLSNYIAERIKQDDQPSIKNLENHCEAFLNHSSLWHHFINVETLRGELGGIYYHLGDFVKAKNILEEIYTNIHDPNKYIKMPQMLVYLGQAYNLLGHRKESEKLFEQGLTIYEQHYPQKYAEIAWVSQNFAHVHAKLGNHKKAMFLLEHSLALYKKYYPQDHLRIAWALKLLGNVLAEQGEYNKAKSLLEQSLAIYNKYYPKSDIMAAWTMKIMGDLYRRQGDYEKAKALLKNCLTNYENYYGKEHLITASALISLGEVYLQEGGLDTSEDLLRKALKIFKQCNHPEGYMPLESLANIYFKRSSLALKEADNQQAQQLKTQAINYLSQALEILKINFPANSPHMKRVHSKLEGEQKKAGGI